MVDLETPGEEDIRVIRDMIGEHQRLTGSAVAKFILEDFESQLRNFVKVFPRDYRIALQKKGSLQDAVRK
jgi:glutamate synthase (NADPH/NADH) large chain